MLKWVEAFTDFLSRKVGVRSIPLAYVIRATVDVGGNAPALATNKPHSTEHGSVEGELVARASHDHPLYREDNSEVYYHLEESLRGTSYAPSLKPFQRAKDGRSALRSVINQYAGVDKWEAELTRQDEFIHNRRWKGQNNFSLERFIAQHRNAFVSMSQCAQHVEFQLPNEYTRVGYLLTAIQTSDPKLQAAIAVVESDTGAGGKRSDFEATASYLLPKDPVELRQRSANKGRTAGANISSVDVMDEPNAEPGANVAAFGAKPGRGKTGVHLRYYKFDEYKKLTPEQKTELHEWRGTQKSGGGKSKATSKPNSAKVSTTVAKEIKRQLKAIQSEADEVQQGDKELESYILSVMEKRKADNSAASIGSTKKTRVISEPTQSVTYDASTSALNTILRRVKNSTKK